MIVVVYHTQTDFTVYKVCELDCTRSVVGSCDPAKKLCTSYHKNDSWSGRNLPSAKWNIEWYWYNIST